MENATEDTTSFSFKCNGHVVGLSAFPPITEQTEHLQTLSSDSTKDGKCKDSTKLNEEESFNNNIIIHNEDKTIVAIDIESNESTNVPETVIVPADSRNDVLKIVTNKTTLRRSRTRSHPIKIAPVELDSHQLATKTFLVESEKHLTNDENKSATDGSTVTTAKDQCRFKDPSNRGSFHEDDNDTRYWFMKYTKKQRLTLLSLCLVDFTSFLGMSIMAPFFPMEANQKGMDEATVGFVFSAYALVMFLASPLFGHMLPHVGSKFMFLSGLFLAGGCTVLFGILDELSGTTFLIFCFVIRSFEALGAAAYNTASCTMVAEMFPDNIGAVFGLLETFVGLGSAIGPAIGGTLYAVGGYKLPFFLLGAFMILMVPINMCLLPFDDTGAVVRSGSMMQLLKLPPVLVLSLIIIVQASAWAFLDPYLEPHLEEFSLNTETVGLIFLMLAATYGIFCPIWGWVADRWDFIRCMMITGMIVTSFSLLLLGPSDLILPFLENELWLNMLSLIIMGVAMAMALIPTFQSMMDCAFKAGFKDDVSTYSMVSGTWSAAYSFGDFTGPSIGGILVTNYGFPSAATGIAALIAVGVLIALLYEASTSFKRLRSDSSISGTFKNLPSDVTEQTPLLKSL